MSDVMIKINNVSKEYTLGQIGGTTLREELQRKHAKLHHKEDPTRRVDATYVAGEKFLALDGVSLTVNKGERVGIIGHNGAGKSTLLKLLSRVTAPTSGTIGLNGRIASMLEVGTGFHGELTGRENIYMNGAILGMTRKEIDAKIESIIEFSECRKFIDTPVKRYSSGMYVKLAFAVAANLDSEIMIMDEVLAVGDVAFQKKCIEKMSDVSRTEGRTVLYVSHNMFTVRQLCDRCVVMDHGKIIFDGEVEEAIALYIGKIGELKTHYVYEHFHHLDPVRRVEIVGLDVYDREETKYEKGEPIKFVLHTHFNEDHDHVRVRFEAVAGGSTVGSSFSNIEFTGKKGEYVDVNITLPTDNFAPAEYHFIGLVYEMGDFGDQQHLDRIEPAMSFEIIDSSEGALVWRPNWFGYTKYDDMIIDSTEVL